MHTDLIRHVVLCIAMHHLILTGATINFDFILICNGKNSYQICEISVVYESCFFKNIALELLGYILKESKIILYCKQQTQPQLLV